MRCLRATLRVMAVLFSRCARPEFIAGRLVRRDGRDASKVSFFQVPEAAEQAGFRACRRCHPRRARASDPQIELVRQICHVIDEHDEELPTLQTLSA